MSSLDTTPIGSINEDSVSSVTKTGSSKKHHQQYFATQSSYRPMEDGRDKTSFYKDLYQFHESKGYNEQNS